MRHPCRTATGVPRESQSLLGSCSPGGISTGSADATGSVRHSSLGASSRSQPSGRLRRRRAARSMSPSSLRSNTRQLPSSQATATCAPSGERARARGAVPGVREGLERFPGPRIPDADGVVAGRHDPGTVGGECHRGDPRAVGGLVTLEHADEGAVLHTPDEHVSPVVGFGEQPRIGRNVDVYMPAARRPPGEGTRRIICVRETLRSSPSAASRSRQAYARPNVTKRRPRSRKRTRRTPYSSGRCS